MIAIRHLRRRSPQIFSIILLILQPVIFFWRTVVGLRSHIPYDIEGYHLPQIGYIAQCLRTGVAPLWDPYSYCGMPIHSDMQAQLFYPPAWLVMLAGNLSHTRYLFYALEWMDPVHMILAGLFTFFLLRRMGLGVPTALLGASVFQLGGFFASQAQHLGAVCAAAWLPLAAWAIFEQRRGLRARWLAILALAAAMSILSGFAAAAIVIAGASVLFAIALIAMRQSSWRIAGPVVAGFVWGSLIAAVVLIPGLTLTHLSIASQRYLWTTYGGGMSPDALVSLVSPNHYHIFDLVNFKRHDNFTFLYTYCGIVPLLLIALTPFIRRWRSLVFLAATVLAALWMLGENTPVYAFIFPHLPRLLRGAMYPQFALIAFSFFAGVTAAFQLDRLSGRLPRLLLWALVLFTSWDLIHTGWKRPMNTVDGGPRLGDRNRDDLEGAAAVSELFRSLTGTAVPPSRVDYIDTAFIQGHHAAGVMRVFTPDGDNPFMLRRMHRLRMMFASGNPWERVFAVDRLDSPLLNMLNVSFLAGGRELSAEALAKAGLEPVTSSHGINVYRNPRALPRFYLTPRIRKSAKEDDTFRYLAEPSFDPATQAIVEGIPSDRDALAVAPVHVDSFAGNRIQLTVATTGPAFLVTSEPMFPGWHATVNGVSEPLLMTNGAFRGLSLPPGQSRIVMEYRPDNLVPSLILSLLSLFPALALVLARRKVEEPLPVEEADVKTALEPVLIDLRELKSAVVRILVPILLWIRTAVFSLPKRPTLPDSAASRPLLRAVLWLPLVLFVALAGYQAFGPVPIGMANNGDFGRVLGSLRLWPDIPLHDDRHETFRHFLNDYVVDDPRWDSGIPSSEWLLATLAKQIASVVLPPGTFKLQIMGLLHGAILALAVFIFLRALRTRAPWVRFVCGFLLVVIWADRAWVQQLNTAYTDAGAIVALALLFAIAVHWLLNDSGWPWPFGFALAGCFLIATKTQHQTALAVLIPFCLLAAFRARDTRDRITWLAVPLLLLGTAAWMLQRTPRDYRTAPAFTVLFYKVATLAPDPKPVLADFHMPESEFLKYVGHYWYESWVPSEDAAFRNRMLTLVSPTTLASFYLRNPAILAKVLLFDLHHSAPEVALDSYGHLRPVDIRAGRHPFELLAWSHFRERLYAFAPNHPIWLFGLAIAFSGICMLNPRVGAWWPGWPLVLFSSVLAVLSFAFASLLDAAETARHLLFFQVSTDLTFLSIALSTVLAVEGRLPMPQYQLPRLPRPAFAQVVRVAGVAAAIALVWLFLRHAPAVPRLRSTENVPARPSPKIPRRGSFDNTSDEIGYFGPWIRGSFASAIDGTTSYSNETGSRAKLSFTGTEITWVYAKAFNRGIASVKIDGVARGEVDQYSPTVIWQSKTTFAGLAPGAHTLELTVTGRKDPAATDRYIDLDALIAK